MRPILTALLPHLLLQPPSEQRELVLILHTLSMSTGLLQALRILRQERPSNTSMTAEAGLEDWYSRSIEQCFRPLMCAWLSEPHQVGGGGSTAIATYTVAPEDELFPAEFMKSGSS
jgi:hypothetical protein